MKKMISTPSSNATDLVTIAKSDLSIAKKGKFSEDTRYEELCNHCQQAVEKSFKALITHHGISFPADHSIENLIHYCEEKKIEIPNEIKSTSALIVTYEDRVSLPFSSQHSQGKVVSLSDYAGDLRYTMPKKMLDELTFLEILSKSEKIVGWVEKQVHGSD